MDNAEVLYRSRNPNILTPVGMGRRKFPLSPDSKLRLATYAFDVELSGLLDSIANNVGGASTLFPSVVFNTPASSSAFNLPAGSTGADPNAILVNYSQATDIGSGLGKFTATFQRVPASWDDGATYNWTPPGWIGPTIGATGANQTVRDLRPKNITVRQHHDYFVIDSTGLVAGILDSGNNAIVAPSGADSLLNGNTGARVVASVQAIPLIFEAHFCNTLINSGSPQTPVYTSWTNSLTPLGGTSLFNETFPTIANYQVWMANVKAIQAANGNPWTGLVWDGGAASAPYLDQNQSLITQFIIKDSDLKQFSGNIWERITTYALAV